MFDKIRLLIAMYKEGTLVSWEGAKLVHELIGEILSLTMLTEPLVEMKKITTAPTYDIATAVCKLEAILPENQPDRALAPSEGAMDWSRWLPVLIQILSEIFARKQ